MVATWETTALIEQDLAHMLHPVTNLHRHAKDGPLVLAEGKGSMLWDTDGKEYIDGFAGLWNVNVGHGRAELALWALVGVYVLLTFHWSQYTTSALAMV